MAPCSSKNYFLHSQSCEQSEGEAVLYYIAGSSTESYNGEQTGIEQNALDGAEGEAGQYLVMLISRENAVPKRAKASCEFMSSGATAAPAAPYGVWDVREATRSRGGGCW